MCVRAHARERERKGERERQLCMTIYIFSYSICFIYIYIYIVIHRQSCFVLSELFSVARQVRFPKLGSKPGRLKRQSKILPLSHEQTCANKGNLNAYVSQLFFCLHIPASRLPRARFILRALHYANGNYLLPSLESSTLEG